MIDLIVLAAATASLLGPAGASGASGTAVGRGPRSSPIGDERVSDSCRTSVISPQQPGRVATYSAARVLGLLFRTAIVDPLDAPRLRLRLYAPGGSLYQVLRYRLPRAVPLPPRRRSAPRPPVLEASVPIAGSQVMWGSLYGRWTAVTTLDGEPASCGRPVSFVITP
jgi:hypothetical protein